MSVSLFLCVDMFVLFLEFIGYGGGVILCVPSPEFWLVLNVDFSSDTDDDDDDDDGGQAPVSRRMADNLWLT